jgi:hypothetical protein
LHSRADWSALSQGWILKDFGADAEGATTVASERVSGHWNGMTT